MIHPDEPVSSIIISKINHNNTFHGILESMILT